MRLRRRREKDGESQQAIEDAEANVEAAKLRNPEVYQVAGQLKRLRQQNHFAAEIYVLMRGRPRERDA